MKLCRIVPRCTLSAVFPKGYAIRWLWKGQTILSTIHKNTLKFIFLRFHSKWYSNLDSVQYYSYLTAEANLLWYFNAWVLTCKGHPKYRNSKQNLSFVISKWIFPRRIFYWSIINFRDYIGIHYNVLFPISLPLRIRSLFSFVLCLRVSDFSIMRKKVY